MQITARASCPNCKKHISLFQACWYGQNKIFKCSFCKERIFKTSIRMFIIAPLSVFCIYMYNREDEFNEKFFHVFLFSIISIALDAYFNTEIKRSDI